MYLRRCACFAVHFLPVADTYVPQELNSRLVQRLPKGSRLTVSLVSLTVLRRRGSLFIDRR